mmetsp:Transcript_1830/g.5387  ORF Transcript_1830/g.5387 Transcript_1830/m.5387 type:complete len:294 (-) Transcript_1830:98-979(-)
MAALGRLGDIRHGCCGLMASVCVCARQQLLSSSSSTGRRRSSSLALALLPPVSSLASAGGVCELPLSQGKHSTDAVLKGHRHPAPKVCPGTTPLASRRRHGAATQRTRRTPWTRRRDRRGQWTGGAAEGRNVVELLPHFLIHEIPLGQQRVVHLVVERVELAIARTMGPVEAQEAWPAKSCEDHEPRQPFRPARGWSGLPVGAPPAQRHRLGASVAWVSCLLPGGVGPRQGDCERRQSTAALPPRRHGHAGRQRVDACHRDVPLHARPRPLHQALCRRVRLGRLLTRGGERYV